VFCVLWLGFNAVCRPASGASLCGPAALLAAARRAAQASGRALSIAVGCLSVLATAVGPVHSTKCRLFQHAYPSSLTRSLCGPQDLGTCWQASPAPRNPLAQTMVPLAMLLRCLPFPSHVTAFNEVLFPLHQHCVYVCVTLLSLAPALVFALLWFVVLSLTPGTTAGSAAPGRSLCTCSGGNEAGGQRSARHLLRSNNGINVRLRLSQAREAWCIVILLVTMLMSVTAPVQLTCVGVLALALLCLRTAFPF
jgi:hypothetical protein